MTDLTQEHSTEEKETVMSKSSRIVLQISGAALFGALSLVISAVTTNIVPRIPGWGIAFIDPVSIIWVMCFLVFGAKSGMLCCVIGTFGLMPFDRSLPIIGPLMKFSATFALIIVPILLLKLYRYEEGVKKSQKIKNPRNFIVFGIFGVLFRIGVMMIANYLLFITVLADALPYVSLDFLGLPGVTGWTAIIIVVIFINAETSLWDLLIPYVIVFGAKIDQKFSIW
jgi:riboflavin transporter FmnP